MMLKVKDIPRSEIERLDPSARYRFQRHYLRNEQPLYHVNLRTDDYLEHFVRIVANIHIFDKTITVFEKYNVKVPEIEMAQLKNELKFWENAYLEVFDLYPFPLEQKKMLIRWGIVKGESMLGSSIKDRFFPLIKECKSCKAVFFATRKNQVCCSNACRQAAYRKRRQNNEQICPICGIEYSRMRSDKKTCGKDSCRKAFYRKNGSIRIRI